MANVIQWTSEDDKVLRELLEQHEKYDYIADFLGIDCNAVIRRAQKFGYNRQGEHSLSRHNKPWTVDDKSYLLENWGTYSVKAIANKLCRTECSIKLMAVKLGLGRAADRSSLLTIANFVEYSGISYYQITGSLSKKHDFPLLKRTLGNSYRYFIDLDQAIKWMEQHQELFDGSKVSEHLVINEPEWLTVKRQIDKKTKQNISSYSITKIWTKEDIDQLKFLINSNKSFQEIADTMEVTKNQVRKQAWKLGLTYNSQEFYRSGDFKYIKDNWQTKTDDEMARYLHKTTISVTKHRLQLGLMRTNEKRRFTDDELNYIRNNLHKTDMEIGEDLGRTEGSINSIRIKLEIKKDITKATWSDQEIQFVRDNVGKMSDTDIGSALGKSGNSVRALRNKLKISNTYKRVPWSESELDFISSNIDKLTDAEFANKLGRSESVIQAMRLSLGLQRVREWTESDLQYIKQNIHNMSDREIGIALGKSASAVRQFRIKHNITREIPWTEESIQYVKDNVNLKTDKEIGIALGKSAQAINSFRKKHNIIKEYIGKEEIVKDEAK